VISNAHTAKQISKLMLDLFPRVDESVAIVKEPCAPEEAVAYIRWLDSGCLFSLDHHRTGRSLSTQCRDLRTLPQRTVKVWR
jgi:hypothetical protein